MKRFTFTLLLFIAFQLLLSAQINGNLIGELITRKCSDSTDITVPENVYLFQTVDDLQSGERIDICVSFNDRYSFNLENIDKSKSLFAEIKPIDNSEIEPNSLFTLSTTELIKNIHINMNVPTKDGNSTTVQTKKIKKGDSQNQYWWGETCFVTDNFDFINIKSIVMELNISEEMMYFNLNYFGFFKESHAKINKINIPEKYKIDTEYIANLSTLCSYDNSLIMNQSNYPEVQNQTYVNVSLDENPSTPILINLIINDWESINFQTATGLQGGLVNGSDSIRHRLNLVINGPNMCLTAIDVHIPYPGSLTFKKGDFHFNSNSSCFLFHPRSKFIIDKKSDLIYGQKGIGMLALSNQSKIILKENSNLEINNTIVLIPNSNTNSASVFLQKGSSFSFGKNGHIRTGGKKWDKEMYLNIYMQGGLLDLSNLNENEKSLIRIFHPKTSTILTNNIKILENPVINNINYSIISDDNKILEWFLLDMNQRLVLNGNKKLNQGINYHSINVDLLQKGVYFLVFKIDGESVVRKIITF